MKAESELESECELIGCPGRQQFSKCLRHREASIFFSVDAIRALTHRRKCLPHHREVSGAVCMCVCACVLVCCGVVVSEQKINT